MKLGIIQGRLAPPVNNQIQEFPENWKIDFEYAVALGLGHMELIITPKSFPHALNFPFWGLLEYNVIHKNTICCDHLIDSHIKETDFLAKNLRPVCQYILKKTSQRPASSIHLPTSNPYPASITIPLLEKSKISIAELPEFTTAIQHYGEVFPDIDFYFEMDAPYQLALELTSKCPNFYLTYDTGNITAWGYEHSAYIYACKNLIKNVHLKDTKNGISVEPGTGDTDFELIFKTLKKIGYNGGFTLQTARGETGKEFETIKRHKEFFERLYEIL